MKNTLIFLVVMFFSVLTGFGQKKYWSKLNLHTSSQKELLNSTDSLSVGKGVYQLDEKSFLEDLKKIDENKVASVKMSFPCAGDRFRTFDVSTYSVMDKELAAKYPLIKTYRGGEINGGGSKVCISVTPLGTQVLIREFGGDDVFIDIVEGSKNSYTVKARSENTRLNPGKCLGIEDDIKMGDKTVFSSIKDVNNLVADGKLREYRLAIATTVEYSNFQLRRGKKQEADLYTKKSIVLSAVVMTVNRLNSILESDLGIKFQLVKDNDKIIFIDNNPFEHNYLSALIDDSQKVIDGAIGFDNYDLGHTMSTGAGGLASLGGLGTNRKAKGVTGSYAPFGDSYDVDFVLHEIGHQLGATHTFSNYSGGAASLGTLYEPGSGSTIMGYAGMSAPNIQDYSDGYFHFISLIQMRYVITSQSNVGKVIQNKVTVPIVNAGKNYVIPYGTPFKLSGNVENAKGLKLVYNWEQADKALLTQPAQPEYTEGTNFRSLKPSISSERYFPNFKDVLDGNLKPTWEVLPTVAREMNFVFTARNLTDINGGQTVSDGMAIKVINTGPFQIKSFGNLSSDGTIALEANKEAMIEWDVAGTNYNEINTKYVDIYYSDDDGASFQLLRKTVPNIGRVMIWVPGKISDKCRIMVQAVNNIFYTVSKKFRTIEKLYNSRTVESNDLMMYPNPTYGQTVFSFASDSGNDIYVSLYDMKGRLVFNEKYTSELNFKKELDFNGFEPGIYVATVNDGKTYKTSKLVIKK